MVPGVSSTSSVYEAVRHHAGIIDRSDRGRIVVSGKDRASYLQGMLTNDIAALAPGTGCYSAFLTPQGRMIADLWLYELGDVILITLSRDITAAFLAKLDQFIFGEDVQLGDVSETFAHVALVGPEAAAILASVLTGVAKNDLSALGEHGNRRARFGDQACIVLRVTDTGEPGFDILVEAAARDTFIAALHRAGAIDVDGDVAEILRIEAGIPKFHRDMDEETIPLEAGIESRAISFSKGCYVGQEVIIRVLHRGHGRVARKLVGLTFESGSVPAAGAAVRVDGRDVGRVTSSVMSAALNCPIALAYVGRDFLTVGTRVTVADTAGVVTELPFVKRSA